MKIASLLVFAAAAAALKVEPTAQLSRRAAISALGMATAAFAPPSAFAAKGDENDEDAVLQRAKANKLNVERVIKRAKAGKLIDGQRASCTELERMIKIDSQAVAYEKGKLAGLEAIGDDTDDVRKTIEIVKTTEAKIAEQVKALKILKKEKKASGQTCE